MYSAEASELQMNVAGKREQVTVSSPMAHGTYLAWDAPPSAHWLWAHGLAEPSNGFHFTCRYPEG